jgi:asparagine synthase (glutamine-hydrolysing)
MCGIAGIVNFDADLLDREIVKKMIHTLQHRGPDDEGIFSDRNVVLGHVRLSMFYTDCKLWLSDNLPDHADRMTMGASVECRVPFLDHQIVELAFGLPTCFKVKGFTRKWQVKQIALRYLPERIVNRRKIGFSVPLAQWFRGKLRDMCYDRICRRNGLMGQLFHRHELQTILDNHCSNRKDNALKIWTLLGLSIWNDVFCNNPIARDAL